MARLSNQKQERFCKALASGMSQYDAHEAAGYKANFGNASALANKPHIKKRVMELTKQARANHEMEIMVDGGSSPRLIDPDDPDSLSLVNLQKEMIRNLYMARDRGQISQANKALEMLARTVGAIDKIDEGKVDDKSRPKIKVEKLNIALQGVESDVGRESAETDSVIDGDADYVEGRDTHVGPEPAVESD